MSLPDFVSAGSGGACGTASSEKDADASSATSLLPDWGSARSDSDASSAATPLADCTCSDSDTDASSAATLLPECASADSGGRGSIRAPPRKRRLVRRDARLRNNATSSIESSDSSSEISVSLVFVATRSSRSALRRRRSFSTQSSRRLFHCR